MADDDDIAVDIETLLVYYEAQEPEYATEEKVHKVIRSFKKKAKKIEGGDWREMMYAAFSEQRGIDPREHYQAALDAATLESDAIGLSRPASLSAGTLDSSGEVGEVGGEVGLSRPASLSLSVAESPPAIGVTRPASLDDSVDSVMQKLDGELNESLEAAPAVGLSPAVSFEATPGGAMSRLDRLEMSAYSPGMTPSAAGTPGEPTPPPALIQRTQSEEEMEEEMAGIREEYLMDLFTNCQTCLDPISGEKLLVADLSYTIRMLSVQERYNLRSENELANDIEDNLIFERRSATSLETAAKTIVGTEDSAGLFARDAEDVSKDGSTILLTEKQKFKRVSILGAPACGKTTLLQKMRYWAALKAYEDPDEDLPVFVALASFAAFVDNGLAAGKSDSLSIMEYLRATCSDDNFRMLEYYHRRGKLLMLCDGLDESAHVKELVQRYLAEELTEEAARVVVSSRLAGFSDEFLSDNDFQFVQLELCTAEVQKLTAKRRMTEGDFERFCALLVEQPMLSAYATTPLTLSLLIQLFKHNMLVSEDELAMYGMVMNRGALYEAGCLHMLNMTERRQQRIEAGSKEKFPTLDIAMDGEVWTFLEVLALDLHQRGTRDFMIADVERLGFMPLWERLEPYLLNYMVPILMRLEVDLTTASIRRTSMSQPEPTEAIAELRQQKSRDDAVRYQWRFIHLTFQEFFTARRMLTILKSEMGQKKFYTASRTVFGKLLAEKLYDAWYREALLLLASSADDEIFSELIDFLLADSDGSQSSGVNDHLVVVMLEERREHPKYEAKRTAVRKAQEARLFNSVLAAMSHPYEVLRREAAEQLHSLDMSIGNIARQMSKELQGSGSQWFAIVAMMESLIDIRATYEAEEGEEAGVVGDGKQDSALAEVIAKNLLGHDDLDVERAAARGIGAIGVSTNAVMFGLLDKLDNGHRYVLQDVSVALLKLGMGWSEITNQVMMRCNRPVLRASTAQIDDDTPNAEWLAVADALGNVLPSEEAKLAAIPELDRVLNHADVEVSVAGARSLGRLGGGMRVITFCREWLQPEQNLEDRLSSLKALRALGAVQLELTVKDVRGTPWDHTPRTRGALERERPMVLDMFVELLRDKDPIIRSAAASALMACCSEDDAWEDAVEHLSSIPLEADGVEQLVEGAAALAMVYPKGANDELVMKLTEVMEQAEWRLSKGAAGTLVTLAPENSDIVTGLIKWANDGFYVQQLEAIQLLGKTQCPEALDDIVGALLGIVEGNEAKSPLAVAAVDALAQLGQSSEAIVDKFIDIILAGDAADASSDDVPLQAAALNAIALMESPPKQLSSLVNRVLLSSEGLSYMLWEPCAKALRVMVDKEMAKDKEALASSGRGDKVAMQFDLQRADEERALLAQASEALFSHNVGKKGGTMSVDASGRQVIGLSGRRMIHKMHPAIEVAMETLEGNLLVMRRADKTEAASAAASAIEALNEPSDVLAAWLLDRITTVPTAPAGLARCVGIRNPEVLRALLRKIGSTNFEERRRALAVVSQLEIKQDFQAYVAMMVVSEEPTTGYLCKALHTYFVNCAAKNPRWKLCEPLHMTLLRQQKANPKCIDFGFLLKELRLSGALTHVELTPDTGRRGSLSMRGRFMSTSSTPGKGTPMTFTPSKGGTPSRK